MDNNKLDERMAQLVMVKGIIDGLANNWPCDMKCSGCPASSVCYQLTKLQTALKDVVG